MCKGFEDTALCIVLNLNTADEIVATVKAIAPSYGGINLEDIAAPLCFEVEERLKAELDIPVMHDDQHGTAIVTLAGEFVIVNVDVEIHPLLGVEVSVTLTVYVPADKP